MEIKLSDERCEEIKLEVLKLFKTYNIHCVPINGFEIATKMGIRIVLYSSLDKEELMLFKELSDDGFNCRKKGQCYIYVNDLDYAYNVQNNIMLHEIAHICLGHTEDSELAEKEAKFFSKYALAPPILIYKLKLTSAKEISNIFNISHQASVYALDYFHKWLLFSGKIKPYENEIAELFNLSIEFEGGDA